MAVVVLGSVQFGKYMQKFRVFPVSAHRYANAIWETHPSHGAHDYSAFQEFAGKRLGLKAKIHQYEIRERWHKFNAELREP